MSGTPQLRPANQPSSTASARKLSTSISDHYSMLRNISSPEEPERPTAKKSSSIRNNVNSLVAKLPSPSTSPVSDGIRSLLRRTNIPFFQDQHEVPPTDGPLTKSFDEVTRGSPQMSALSLDDHTMHQPLSLSDNGTEQEIILESPTIPEVLVTGIPLLRITRKKKVQRTFRIDLDKALVIWNNKSTSRMSLDKIQQIRIADDARNYREEYGVSKEHNDRWATILYNDLSTNKLKALHIIAPTKQDFDLFVGALTKLVSSRRELMKYLSVPGENFAHIHWKNYVSKDRENKELLSFEDVLELTKRLHIHCDEYMLWELFIDNDKGGKGALNFPEFRTFVKTLKVRPEIIRIFHSLTHDTDFMTLPTFSTFIRYTQKQDETDEDIQYLFTKFSRQDVMDVDGFTNYLTSAYVSATTLTPEDLTHPLSEYFISSSHNTYLLGRQYGDSTSIEGYTRALQRGCRSIEIDIWDGDTGPVVSHGKITSSVSVRDVFETVRKYAFIVTPLPLFLSFEIHCKPEYQLVVKDLLLEVFDDMLVKESLLPRPLRLPSPLDLKHKVLVKVKRTAKDASVSNQTSSSSLTSTSTAPEDTTTDDESRKKGKSKVKRKQPKIITELSDLAVYASGLKFTNFSLPESKTVNHIFSFSDHTFNAMTKDPEKDYLIQKHNRKYLMRVYPAGYRYKSSNFLPIKPWLYGVQMVATNWQTYDLGQQLNEAMFHTGSKCGYVLKPQQLRIQTPHVKFKELYESEKTQYIKFTIDIISGQLLPRPQELKSDEILSPYVVFELIEGEMKGPLVITDLRTGEHKSAISNGFSTPAIPMNGFNPLWNHRVEGTFKDMKGLNFIRFLVKTGELPFALSCCKLDTLNQGFRHLPLYDLQGEEYIFSTLFVKVNYEVVDNDKITTH